MITCGLTIVIISILFYINFDFILFSFIVVKTYNINIIIRVFLKGDLLWVLVIQGNYLVESVY